MLPALWRNPITDIIPYCPPSYPVMEVSPETQVAKTNPRLAASVLMAQSAHSTLVGLANSSAATEFARQGRGTAAGYRRRGMIFTQSVEEFAIQPI